MKTLFRNGSITCGRSITKNSKYTCLVVEDDNIQYVGNENDDTIKAIKHEADLRIIDLQNRSLMPSFIDGHMHLLLFASSAVKTPLENCSNLAEIRAKISQITQQNPHAERFFCKGWRQPSTNGVTLASMLDDIDTRPIFIEAEDLHSTWCNTAALRELNVQDMPDPVGGHIHRDEHGNPSGLLSEMAAVTLTWPHFAKVSSLQEKLTCIRSAIKDYSAAGYTGLVEMAMDEPAWNVLKDLRKREPIHLRIAAHWLISPSWTDEQNLAQVERAIQEHAQHNLANSPNFRIAGIKIICDGVIDACTAFVSRPYTTGELPDPLWQPEALRKVLEKADSAGLQCALHAIGDAAVTLAIDCISSLGTTGHRHRIEHLEFTRPEDARRLGAAGITASVQPVHCDPKLLTAWPSIIGTERMSRMFAYREFVDHDAHLTIGTDTPTAPHLALPNLYHATTRRSLRAPDDAGPPPVNPQFALDFKDAMAAATWGAAYSCFAEGFTGSLEVGKKADFVIVEGANEWEDDLDGLLKARIVETWFEGKKVFSAQQ